MQSELKIFSKVRDTKSLVMFKIKMVPPFIRNSIKALACVGFLMTNLFTISAQSDTFDELLADAENGNASSQFNLAFKYMYDAEIPKNKSEAIKWYTAAARQGLLEAQFNLALLYLEDEYLSNAIYWMKFAAEQEHADSQYNLGMIYLKKNSPNAKAETEKWLGLAASQNHSLAQFQLGLIYLDDPTKQKEKAFKWFLRAAENGLAGAQYNVGLAYWRGDSIISVNKQGDANAQNLLGMMLAMGDGIKRDDQQAFRWLDKAARQGNSQSQLLVGSFYAGDKVVKWDLVQAYAWFRLALDLGNEDARSELNYLKTLLTKKQMKKGEKLADKCYSSNYVNCNN
jgi:TPR repeat protein